MQEKIKNELLKEMYTNVDKLYDSFDQHFMLSPDHEKIIIQALNKLKDQLYVIAMESKLS